MAVTVTVIVTADATATAIAIALRTSRVEVVAPLDVEDEEGRGRVNMMIRGWRSACNVGARCAREAGVMGEMDTRMMHGIHMDAAHGRGWRAVARKGKHLCRCSDGRLLGDSSLLRSTHRLIGKRLLR